MIAVPSWKIVSPSAWNFKYQMYIKDYFAETFKESVRE